MPKMQLLVCDYVPRVCRCLQFFVVSFCLVHVRFVSCRTRLMSSLPCRRLVSSRPSKHELQHHLARGNCWFPFHGVSWLHFSGTAARDDSSGRAHGSLPQSTWRVHPSEPLFSQACREALLFGRAVHRGATRGHVAPTRPARRHAVGRYPLAGMQSYCQAQSPPPGGPPGAEDVKLTNGSGATTVSNRFVHS